MRSNKLFCPWLKDACLLIPFQIFTKLICTHTHTCMQTYIIAPTSECGVKLSGFTTIPHACACSLHLHNTHTHTHTHAHTHWSKERLLMWQQKVCCKPWTPVFNPWRIFWRSCKCTKFSMGDFIPSSLYSTKTTPTLTPPTAKIHSDSQAVALFSLDVQHLESLHSTQITLLAKATSISIGTS